MRELPKGRHRTSGPHCSPPRHHCLSSHSQALEGSLDVLKKELQGKGPGKSNNSAAVHSSELWGRPHRPHYSTRLAPASREGCPWKSRGDCSLLRQEKKLRQAHQVTHPNSHWIKLLQQEGGEGPLVSQWWSSLYLEGNTENEEEVFPPGPYNEPERILVLYRWEEKYHLWLFYR